MKTESVVETLFEDWLKDVSLYFLCLVRQTRDVPDCWMNVVGFGFFLVKFSSDTSCVTELICRNHLDPPTPPRFYSILVRESSGSIGFLTGSGWSPSVRLLLYEGRELIIIIIIIIMLFYYIDRMRTSSLRLMSDQRLTTVVWRPSQSQSPTT